MSEEPTEEKSVEDRIITDIIETIVFATEYCEDFKYNNRRARPGLSLDPNQIEVTSYTYNGDEAVTATGKSYKATLTVTLEELS